MGDTRSDSRRMDTHPPVCLGSLGGHTVHFTYRPSLCFQWSYLELSRSSMTDRNDVGGVRHTLIVVWDSDILTERHACRT